jgi:hypothetical protein
MSAIQLAHGLHLLLGGLLVLGGAIKTTAVAAMFEMYGK